jgi:MFS family permease
VGEADASAAAPVAPAAARQAAAPGRWQLRLVFAGLMLAVLLAALDQTIVATALPTIVGELHGLEHMSWAVTAYLLAATIGLTVYGKLGDQFGRKPVFLFAISVFLLGSALTGLAQAMGQLIAFRAVQGIGGGGLTIGAQAIVGELIAPRERGRYVGAFFGMFGLASVAGPLLGGYLTDAWSWRWCFYINLPLGAVTLAIVAAVLRLPRHPTRPRLDYLGAALLAAAVTCMVLATSWGGTRYAWASPTIVVLGVAAAVLLGGFVLAERRVPEPVVPLRLFRSRVFNVANGLGLVIERLDHHQVRRLALPPGQAFPRRLRQVRSHPVGAPGALSGLVAVGGEAQRPPVARGGHVGDLSGGEPIAGCPASQVLQRGGQLVRADRRQVLQALRASLPPAVDRALRQPADRCEHVDGGDRPVVCQQGLRGRDDPAFQPGPRPGTTDSVCGHDPK